MELTETYVPAFTPTRSAVGSFREVVAAHQRAIYYLAFDLTGNHHDAEDLAQEVFIKAHRALDQYRGDASMRTWLRRIAINTYLNKKRKKALAFMRFFEDVTTSTDWEAAASPSPETHASDQVAAGHVDAALARLSPRERSAFATVKT